MSFKQQFEWRLHVTSRPKLLVRSGPVVVAHSLPAGFDRQCGGRARSDQLGCGRPLCARPAPGPLFLFRLLFAQVVRQRSSVLLGAFHARWRAPYIMYMVLAAFAGSPLARFDD